jgi:MoaA/NifB/PqqE/SkfB family radical SAM enzyme
MKTTDVLRGWKTILAGRTPFVSIEITKECPLSCPGCYAYGEEHLGGATILRQVSDYKGKALVDGVLGLLDAYRPVHVSIVGGEPLVRFRELGEILPEIARRNMYVQLVTSAVRPIPTEWSTIKGLDVVVSIDGLQPEHDVRRKPATYEKILKNIEGHKITVHCTITRQMTERPGYLKEFVQFWSSRKETGKIWMSLFTPQVGETSYEILPREARLKVIAELAELGREFPKLAMPKDVLHGYLNPPSDPAHCIFARTTTTFTADLRGRVTPCQFGGTPDCSQCGCMASAGLKALGDYKLPIGITAGSLYEASLKFGALVQKLRPVPDLKLPVEEVS